MQKELVIYPDERVRILGADVRRFNEDLDALFTDLRDTLEANAMEGITATQIGIPFAVLLIRDESGGLLELVNPRIINTEGWRDSEESTGYLPGLKETVRRYDTIKVIYQDRRGTQHHLEASGPFSALIQRKIDFTFGGSILDKLDEADRKRIAKVLNAPMPESNCPTVFYRDYLTRGIKGLFIVELLLLAAGFALEGGMLRSWFFNAMGLLLALIIVYFFYAQYETRRYKSCTSCQTGHIIGNTSAYLVGTAGLALIGYFWLV
jgi:peptide deformylase